MIDLYRRHADALREAREAQRRLLCTGRRLRPRLGDVEAEIAYLLIRDRRPRRVVQIGAASAWSSSWLRRALADNGSGELHAYDLSGSGRLDPATVDLLFIDAGHTARFARWYRAHLLDRLRPGTTVCVHDVYRRPYLLGGGRVVLD